MTSPPSRYQTGQKYADTQTRWKPEELWKIASYKLLNTVSPRRTSGRNRRTLFPCILEKLENSWPIFQSWQRHGLSGEKVKCPGKLFQHPPIDHPKTFAAGSSQTALKSTDRTLENFSQRLRNLAVYKNTRFIHSDFDNFAQTIETWAKQN